MVNPTTLSVSASSRNLTPVSSWCLTLIIQRSTLGFDFRRYGGEKARGIKVVPIVLVLDPKMVVSTRSYYTGILHDYLPVDSQASLAITEVTNHTKSGI
jgi:hypothetical protein